MGIHLGRPFYIQSRLPMQRVVEVVGGRNLVMKTMDRTRETQIFFLDPHTKTIKSVKHRDQSIDIQGAGNSANMQIWSTNNRWYQMFKYVGGHIVNIKNNKVFDVSGNRDTENANLIIYKKHGGLNQQFDIVYLDQLKPDLVKGDWNPEFGFYVEREFSIVTKLGSGRYVDVIGSNIVIKTRSSSKTQKWYFDQTTRTIKSVATKRSWDISSGGRGSNLQVWTTNSGWW